MATYWNLLSSTRKTQFGEFFVRWQRFSKEPHTHRCHSSVHPSVNYEKWIRQWCSAHTEMFVFGGHTVKTANMHERPNYHRNKFFVCFSLGRRRRRSRLSTCVNNNNNNNSLPRNTICSLVIHQISFYLFHMGAHCQITKSIWLFGYITEWTEDAKYPPQSWALFGCEKWVRIIIIIIIKLFL